MKLEIKYRGDYYEDFKKSSPTSTLMIGKKISNVRLFNISNIQLVLYIPSPSLTSNYKNANQIIDYSNMARGNVKQKKTHMIRRVFGRLCEKKFFLSKD